MKKSLDAGFVDNGWLTLYPGLHVYMGGVGFQQFFILIFLYIAFRFQQQVKKENPNKLSQALLLLYAEYAVLILITVGAPFARIKFVANSRQ